MIDNASFADPHDIALAAIYLAKGFDDASLADKHGERYEAWSALGGHVGVMCGLADFAKDLEQWLLGTGKTEFPGVFHYEFTEPLGAWMYANGEPTAEEFRTELERRWTEWTDAKAR